MAINTSSTVQANAAALHNPQNLLRALAPLIFALSIHSTPAIAAGHPSEAVTLDGSELLVDGNPFLPRGLHFSVVQTPPQNRSERLKGVYERFKNDYPRLFQQSKAWNANLISFAVSQPGLDPSSELYSDEYVKQVERAVNLARKAGFIVLVTLNDQYPSGDPVDHKLPNQATLRAWTTLTGLFNEDQGVIYELFNEPQLPANEKNWQLWLRGGLEQEDGPSVGMQKLLNHVRRTGAQNVIVIDGLNWARTFENVPSIKDPLNKYIYGVHPYFTTNYCQAQDWERSFGFLVDKGQPVMVTEWCASTGARGNIGSSCCDGLSGKKISAEVWRLLNFVKKKGIGFNAYGFTSIGTIVQDLDGTPTEYDGYAWNQAGGGPGQAIKTYYSKK